MIRRETQRERQRGNSAAKLNCHFSWIMPVDTLPSPRKKKKSLKTSNTNTFSSSQHVSPRRGFSCIHDSSESVFSPPFTSLSVFDVLHNPAFGHSVFWERDERKWFIHQTRPGIQIPADPLISWLILQIFPRCGCRAALIRAFSGARWAGHHLSRSDSAWQQTQARLTSEKMCTSHHLIQMSNQIRNCRDDSMIWRLDSPVRAVIILLRLEVWILPQVCVFLFLQVNVSHQNFAEGDIHSSKLLWLLWTGNFKTQRGGRWLSAAVRGAEIDTKKDLCVFAPLPHLYVWHWQTLNYIE